MIGDNAANLGAGGLLVQNTTPSFTSINLENNTSTPANGPGYTFDNSGGTSMVVFAPPQPPASATDPRANSGTIATVGTVTFTASPGP